MSAPPASSNSTSIIVTQTIAATTKLRPATNPLIFCYNKTKFLLTAVSQGNGKRTAVTTYTIFPYEAGHPELKRQPSDDRTVHEDDSLFDREATEGDATK